MIFLIKYFKIFKILKILQVVNVTHMDLQNLHVAQMGSAFAKLGSLAKHVPIVSLGITKMELIVIVIF